MNEYSTLEHIIKYREIYLGASSLAGAGLVLAYISLHAWRNIIEREYEIKHRRELERKKEDTSSEESSEKEDEMRLEGLNKSEKTKKRARKLL